MRTTSWSREPLASPPEPMLPFSAASRPPAARPTAWTRLRVACDVCGSLLDVVYDWDRLRPPTSFDFFESKWSRRYEPLCFSGVWRFHELLPFAPREQVVTIGEGQTLLQHADGVGKYVGMRARPACILQYEGMNPSGSFKDNGMSAAFTHAHAIGAKRAACASTGNTSASLALYCCGDPADEGRDLHRLGQDLLRQAVAGARLRRADRADRRRLRRRHGAGQGSLAASWASTWSTASIPSGWKGKRRSCFACSKACAGKCPTGSSCPAATWATRSAFGKAFAELQELGLIDRVPRLAVINAAGANTLYELYEQRGLRWNGGRPDDAIVERLLSTSWTPRSAGHRRSPAPSKSIGR